MATTTSSSVTLTSRIIALVDMDCFYVQVEERDNPSIKGVPAAVVQYKAYKGGGIIAVNYEARAKGVTRNMRGDDAVAVCPEIKLVRVPESRGKADLTKYRDAGREVINVLSDFSSCVERASIDEAYIDLTETVEERLAEISSSQNTSTTWSENVIESLKMEHLATNFVLGYESTNDWLDSLKREEPPSLDDFKLAVAAEIVGKMREAVYQKTKFRCSAGIAHNKVLAKLVCGINKPNKQTVLPHGSVTTLWSKTKVSKVRGLGGKLGEFVEGLGCVYMSDLKKFSEKELCSFLGTKTGAWLYQLSLGYDDESVTPRQLPKSIGCNKNFFGPEALKTKDKTKFWINQLASEVVERIQRDLEMNNRKAKTLTLHVKFENQNPLSRSCGIPQYNAERMATDVQSIMEKLYQSVGVLPINSLGLIASKFEDEADTSTCFKINDFFKSRSATVMESSEGSTKSRSDASLSSSKCGKEQNLHSYNCATLETKDTVDEASSREVFVNGNAVGQKKDETHTPKKSDVANPDSRQPFFKFVVSAPKPVSPLKSPRKLLNSVVSTEAKDAPTVSTNMPEAVTSVLRECERCGKKIAEWDFELHMDYHFAKDLSREINGLPSTTAIVSSNAQKKDEGNLGAASERIKQKRPRGGGGSSSSSKRGRGAKSSVSHSAPTKTIDSYFISKS